MDKGGNWPSLLQICGLLHMQSSMLDKCAKHLKFAVGTQVCFCICRHKDSNHLQPLQACRLVATQSSKAIIHKPFAGVQVYGCADKYARQVWTNVAT